MKTIMLAALLVVLGLVAVPSALAAPPANDTFPNATAVSIGFSETLDTTEATTDADDAQLNASCGAPATDASVWYAIQGTDENVVVDVSQSNYPAGVLVGTGTQGNLTTVACGPGGTFFFAATGTTYYVLAIDDQSDGGGNGGNLNISFETTPPPPTLEVTVNPTGTVNAQTGIATISGTYTCTDAGFFDLLGSATQNVGRFSITGFFDFFASGTCDGSAHDWSASVVPENGKFKGGKAMTVTDGFSCGIFQCTNPIQEWTVQLKGGKK